MTQGGVTATIRKIAVEGTATGGLLDSPINGRDPSERHWRATGLYASEFVIRSS